MQVQIRDKNALASLPLKNVISYLKNHGWTDEGQWGKRPASLYSFDRDAQELHVLIPHRKKGDRDYPELMSRLIETLSEVEGRSEMDIYCDISEAMCDIVRMRPFKTAFGKISSLGQGSGLLNDIHNVFASAARAEESQIPKPVYRGRVSKQIQTYLSLVRPAQSFGMSRSLTIYSPLPNTTLIKDDTFERRVIIKLSDALNCTSNAIKEAQDTDPVESFKALAPNGVSANLCESLATLIGQWKGMTISVAWPKKPTSNIKSNTFKFKIDSAEILESVAKNFRDTLPSMDETITAWVVGAKRKLEDLDGPADLLCERDGKLTHISARFEGQNFNSILKALENKDQIQVVGDVYKVGAKYELRKPRNLVTLSDE